MRGSIRGGGGGGWGGLGGGGVGGGEGGGGLGNTWYRAAPLERQSGPLGSNCFLREVRTVLCEIR